MTSPTQRTLKYYKELGWPADIAECWNPWAGKKSDLFKFIDVVVLSPDGILGVQTTSSTNHTARIHKIMGNAYAVHWLKAGGKIIVMSWNKGEKREQEIKLTDFLVQK